MAEGEAAGHSASKRRVAALRASSPHCGWSPGVVGAESPKVLCYFSAMLAKCCKPEGEQTAQIPPLALEA